MTFLPALDGLALIEGLGGTTNQTHAHAIFKPVWNPFPIVFYNTPLVEFMQSPLERTHPLCRPSSTSRLPRLHGRAEATRTGRRLHNPCFDPGDNLPVYPEFRLLVGFHGVGLSGKSYPAPCHRLIGISEKQLNRQRTQLLPKHVGQASQASAERLMKKAGFLPHSRRPLHLPNRQICPQVRFRPVGDGADQGIPKVRRFRGKTDDCKPGGFYRESPCPSFHIPRNSGL